MTLKRLIRYSAMLLATSGPALHAQEQAQTLAVQVCATCHGPDGRSISPMVPRLAGQRKEYIEAS